MASEDPFLQVQADVLSVLNTSRPLFSSYLRIRSSASSSTSPELVEARTELEAVLKDLQVDLEDLVETVNAVESDPYAFGLEIEEVRRRRQLVDEVGNEVERMREELKQTVIQAQQRANMGVNHSLPDPDTFDDDEDYAAEFEQQRQQELMTEQDDVIDDVLHTVGNLRQQGEVMGREIAEQDQLLEEVDVIADRMESKLQTGIKKIGWVLKQNEDTWSSCCIGVLIVVLILLLVILLAV